MLFAHYVDPFDRFAENDDGQGAGDEVHGDGEAYDDEWDDAFHDDLGDW